MNPDQILAHLKRLSSTLTPRQIATLVLDGDSATVRIEAVEGSDWRDPRLSVVVERCLTAAGQ